MTPDIRIDAVDDLDLASLAMLVAESEAEGWKFVQRLCNEWNDGTNRFDQPGERFFIAHNEEGVIGVCGLNVDPYITDESVGRVRRLYVLKAFRRRGIGGGLVEAVIDHARGRFGTLRVRTENAVAGRLYERLGFERSAGVPDCTHALSMGHALSTKPESLHE